MVYIIIYNIFIWFHGTDDDDDDDNVCAHAGINNGMSMQLQEL